MSDTSVEQKKCIKCLETKTLTEFQAAKQYKDGRRNTCTKCRNAQLQEWKRNNPEKRKAASRRNDLKRKYGITIEEYAEILIRQGSGCAICGNPCETRGILAVDHNHLTNKVRGLLCFEHNTGIGKFSDNPELLRRAAEYLERDGL